ncbi:MAG: hypothetical protein U0136_21580 [Bdellovibrionota bacterium]
MQPSTPAPSTPQFFVNVWVDAFFIGGLTLLSYLGLAAAAAFSATPDWIGTLAAALLVVGNWPHFAATSLRLYGRRENMAQYPLTASVVPAFMALTVWAAFCYPDVVAPYLIKVFLIWSPYHFSGQTTGITMIYARRAGFQISPSARRALAMFIYGTFLVATARAESSPDGGSFYGIRYPGFGIPPIAATLLELTMWGGGALFLFHVLRWWRAQPKLFHPIILLPAVTQAVWFVAGPTNPSFYIFVPFFHSCQYLLIAWAMQLAEKSESHPEAATPRVLLRASVIWGAGVIAGGSALFWLLPRVCAQLSDAPLDFSLGVVIAAVQVHHFFVDGVIWKLRRRTVVQPLMSNIPQLFFHTARESRVSS